MYILQYLAFCLFLRTLSDTSYDPSTSSRHKEIDYQLLNLAIRNLKPKGKVIRYRSYRRGTRARGNIAILRTLKGI
jgi:hypothetical protein